MNRSINRSSIAAIAALLSSLGTNASAQVVPPLPIILYDAKVHHSSECQPNFPSFANALTYFESGLTALSPVQVVCPIVRDNTRNTSGTMGVEIYVTNVGVAPGQNHLACSLYSYDTHDVLAAQSPPAIALALGKQTLKVDVNASKNKGHYSLRCLMPAGAKLHGYEVREWLDGSTNRTDWLN